MSDQTERQTTPSRGKQADGFVVPETIGAGDRYRVDRLIGKGGQGFVCHAHDTNLDIDVAVKILHPEFREEEFIERLMREARIMAAVYHKNIIRVFDLNKEYPYLVMEYCGGGDLNRYIKSRRRRSLSEILTIIRQICEALVPVHEHEPPILHRDLKPGNVLFRHGVLKVADFGLGKMLAGGTGLTVSRGMMGTVRYCSPEQLRDASKVDERSDLWSVGVILYEMLTWCRPFDKADDSFVNIALRVHTEPPRKPPYELPAPVAALIQKVLEKDPERRYRTAREMIEAVDGVLAAVPDSSKILLPPEDVIGEVDRLAAQTSDHLDEGNSNEAASLIDKMRDLAPDDSVGRYWQRRLGEIRPSEASGARPVSDTAERDRRKEMDSKLDSVRSLIAAYSYRDAQRRLFEILSANPDDSVALQLLDQIKSMEQGLMEELVGSRRKAEEARARGDLAQVHGIWTSIDEKYPNHPEISSELAVVAREVELEQRRKLRTQAVEKAAEHERAGDLSAAASVLKRYLDDSPGDQETASKLEAIQSALRDRQRAKRLAEIQSRAAALREKTDLDGALSLWKTFHAEDPDCREAAEAVAALENEIAALRLAEARQEARSEAEGALSREDYAGALRVWQRFLGRYPGDTEAVGQIELLESAVAEQRRKTLASGVQDLVDRIEEQATAGRYASLSEAGSRIAQAVKSARASLSRDESALEEARRGLMEAEGDGEQALSLELDDYHGRLVRLVGDAREWLGGSAPGGTAATAEAHLENAMNAALGALCSGSSSAGGDPIAPLSAAAEALEGASAMLARERQQAVDEARQRAASSLDAAQKAAEELQSIDEGAPAYLEKLAELRALAESPVPGKLLDLAGQAQSLKARMETHHLMVGWEASRRLEGLLGEAQSLLLRDPGESLETLVDKTSRLLGDTDSAIAVPDLISSAEDLRLELRRAREAVDERMAAATRRWEKALEDWRQVLADVFNSKAPAEAQRAVSQGESSMGMGHAEQLESWAIQLESLTQRYRLESAWMEQSDRVQELEGGLDREGLPQRHLPPARQALLAGLRQAVAAGRVEEVRQLASEVQQAHSKLGKSPSKQARTGPLEVPDLSPRMRKFNSRYAAGLLERFDELSARVHESVDGGRRTEAARLADELNRLHGKLVEPAPLWKPIAMAAAAMVVAAGLYYVRPADVSTATVHLVSPGGSARIEDARTADGATVRELSGLTVSEAGETRELAAGRYRIRVEGGAETTFEVPGQTLILLPGDPGAYSAALEEQLQLEEPAQEAAGGN